MTALTKPISRRTIGGYKVIYSSEAIPIVVTLEPTGDSDLIHFRHLRRRQQFTLSIEDVFRYAVRAYALKDARAKKLAKKEKQKGIRK